MKIIGKIYYGDKIYKYTNEKDYIEAIKYQLKYIGINFKYKTYDEKLKNEINKLILNELGY